jgi:hypothetical protein
VEWSGEERSGVEWRGEEEVVVNKYKHSRGLWDEENFPSITSNYHPTSNNFQQPYNNLRQPYNYLQPSLTTSNTNPHTTLFHFPPPTTIQPPSLPPTTFNYHPC